MQPPVSPCCLLPRSWRDNGIPIGRDAMNWDEVQGKWKEYKGKMKEKWGKLSDDDFDVIDGKRQELVGKVQQRYGIAKEEAERQADEFVKSLGPQGSEPEKARGASRT